MAKELDEFRKNYPLNLVFGLDPLYTKNVIVDESFELEGGQVYHLRAYVHSSTAHAVAYSK